MKRNGYTLLIGAVGVQRLTELAISRRNAAWAFARGASRPAGATSRR